MRGLPPYPDGRVRALLTPIAADFAALWQAVGDLLMRADAHESTPMAVATHDASAYRCIGAGNSWVPAGTPTLSVSRLGENVAVVWVVTSGDALTIAVASNDLRLRLPDGIVPAAVVQGAGRLTIGGVVRACTVATVADDGELRISRDDAGLATDAAFGVAFTLPFPLRLR